MGMNGIFYENRCNNAKQESVFAADTNLMRADSVFGKVGSIVTGTVCKIGDKAAISIGNVEVAVSPHIVEDYEEGDTVKLQVASCDGRQVALKAMQQFANVSPSDCVLGSLSQTEIQRNTEQFVHILSESDLRIDVVSDVKEDAREVTRFSPEELQMLRQLGIDVANGDFSHLIGLVNQYRAQQEGRTFVTSSPEVTQTIAKAQNLSKITDEMARYMMENDLSISYSNVYKAEHSTGISDSRELSEEEWQQLAGQAEKILQAQGMKVNNDNLSACKWMIEQNVDISAANIMRYQQIQQWNEKGLNQDDYLHNLMRQAQIGEPLEDAVLVGESPVDVVADIINKLQSVDKRAVDVAVKEENEHTDSSNMITLQKIFRAQQSVSEAMAELEKANVPVQTEPVMVSDENTKQEDASRQDNAKSRKTYAALEEIRLCMTLKAGYQLLNKGVFIETDRLQNVLEELRNITKEQTQSLFRDSKVEQTKENVSLYYETMAIAQSIPKLPSVTLGRVLDAENVITLRSVYQHGIVVEAKDAPLTSLGTVKDYFSEYEKSMTKPRSDMGDSMKKAFSNVDEMLMQMNMDLNSQNRKAVQILAYNQIELSEENVEKIATLDQNLMHVVEKLQPETVLSLIREGVNPVEMNLITLKNKIKEIEEKNGKSHEEKYSEFLHRLDKTHGITREERETYIGIYRLLHAVTSFQDRDLGAVVKNGQELTLKNLLTAHRSRKQTGMNVAVDDDFGMVREVAYHGSSITDQIASAFEEKQIGWQTQSAAALADNVLEHLLPKDLQSFSTTEELGDATLEQLRQLQQFGEVEPVEPEEVEMLKSYLKELQEELEDEKIARESIELLEGTSLPYTPASLKSAVEMVKTSTTFYQQIKKQWRAHSSEDAVSKNMKQLEEDLFDWLQEQGEMDMDKPDTSKTDTPKDKLSNVFESFTSRMDEVLHDGEESVFSIKDLYGIRQIHSSLRLAQDMAKNRDFLIPVSMEGEVLTLAVSFSEKGEEDSSIVARTENTLYGVMEVRADMKQDTVQMYFSCEDSKGEALLKAQEKQFLQPLQQLLKQREPMSDNTDVAKDRVSSQAMYEVAKNFVATLRKMG